MPIYPIVCQRCDHRGDIYAKAADSDRLRCPRCDGPAVQDYAAKNIGHGAADFKAGKRESLTEWFHPAEVAEARRELGDAGSCVRDDGTVHFRNRQEQRKYLTAKADIMKRAGRRPDEHGRRRAKSISVGD